MALTDAQLATIKTAVIADPTAGPMRTAGDTVTLLGWLNGAKSPVTLAWRVNMNPQLVDEAANYSAFDSIVAGKRDSWGFFLKYPRSFGPARIRTWVTDVWGAATASSVAEGILQAATESATNAQAILGGTSRTTGTVVAIERVWAEMVSQAEVNRIIN